MPHVSFRRLHPDGHRPSTLAIAGALALAALFLPGSASAQQITRQPDGSISVRATDVPLGRLLHELAAVMPFGEILLSRSVEDRPVTMTLERVTIRRAVAAALETAGVGYVLGATRLVAGDAAFRGVAPVTGDGAIDPRTESKEAEDAPELPAPSAAETARVEAEARSRAIALEQDLQPPPIRLGPGDHVMLPFPGPDGVTPLSIVKPAGPPLHAVPFPLPPGPRPMIQVVPPPTDPRLIELINALAPKRGAGR